MRVSMKKFDRFWKAGALIGIALLVMIGGGCAPSEERAVEERSEQIFEVDGWMRAVADSGETVTIQHEEIPGFMPAMTMPFYLKDRSLADGLEVGDRVRFRYVVGENESWIDRIEKVEGEEAASVSPEEGARANALRARIPRLEEGDVVPSFQLINQDGERFETGDFRGEALAISFIFTRCPVPDFCPRMSKNFAELQRKVEANPDLRDRVHLLSVTIDPAFDTPEVLRRYAATYTDSTENWTFATGEAGRIEEMRTRFAIFVDSEAPGGNIDHALGTALVDPEGRLASVWWGNRWTTDEVLEAISTTLEENKD